MYRRFGKRVLDLILVLPALVVLSPVMGIVALLVRRRLGAPVLFRQERPGLGGRPFTLLKFRSMTDARDADGRLLPDAERLSSFGKRLRAWSVDELPELVNVVRGDMSLVGPRPLLVDYLPHYSQTQARRHDVRPGLTGWAQVNGRNTLDWDEKFAMDVWYVDNVTLRLDLTILSRTLLKVLRREGISAGDHATMQRFDDSKNARHQ